ncbi:adhesin [Paenibacillus macerans]|uniref:adhesin n=1 Tax=Paenibacillus macerans TaxID=44252 RepID=UPI003D319628
MVITDGAKSYIEEMMKEAGVSTLRFVLASGCCGPSFQLTLENAQETDIVKSINDIEVAIDPQVEELVSQVTLDLEQDEEGAGLVISGGSNCC